MGVSGKPRRFTEGYLAGTVLDHLVFEISTSPAWRDRLFAVDDFVRFAIPDAEVSRLVPDAEGAGLHFAVFLDGVTGSGAFVFGFECREHPSLTRYSTNPRSTTE